MRHLKFRPFAADMPKPVPAIVPGERHKPSYRSVIPYDQLSR
jgi:hypothetical protein